MRLDRPLLAQRLAAAIERGHVQIAAPAGAGKTWALEDALALRGGAAAWVRCTPADADPGRLVAKLVAGIDAAAPGAAGDLPAILAGATEPIPALRAARALAAALARHWQPLAVAVDDAEHLGPESLDVLRCSPEVPGLRLAVLSDRELPLEGFGELEPAHLAFTHRECASLLGPPPPAAESVWSATAGRPLLVALAARTRRVPPAGTPSDDELAAALLEPLPPAVRVGIVDAALAPELDAAVARALELPDDFVGIVRRSGIPQREQAGAVVLHPLVRAVLVRRLERERPGGYRELLHGRVAAGLDAAGRGPEAVEHWLEVPERAAAAVARHADALLATAPATVARWLGRIAGPERMAPELQAIEGRLAIAAGRPLDADEPLRGAILGFEARGEAGQAWAARLALADALAIAERFEAVLPLAGGFETAAVPAAPMTGIVAAAAEAALGGFDAAVERFERAVALPHGEHFVPFADAFRATWVDVVRGDLDAALRRVRGAAGALEREDPFGRLAYVLAMQAAIHEERGEDDAALETIARARAVAARKALGGLVEDIGRRLAAGPARARRAARRGRRRARRARRDGRRLVRGRRPDHARHARGRPRGARAGGRRGAAGARRRRADRSGGAARAARRCWRPCSRRPGRPVRPGSARAGARVGRRSRPPAPACSPCGRGCARSTATRRAPRTASPRRSPTPAPPPGTCCGASGRGSPRCSSWRSRAARSRPRSRWRCAARPAARTSRRAPPAAPRRPRPAAAACRRRR